LQVRNGIRLRERPKVHRIVDPAEMTTRSEFPRWFNLAACAWLVAVASCGSSDDSGTTVDASALRDASPDGGDSSVIDAATDPATDHETAPDNDGRDALPGGGLEADVAITKDDATGDAPASDVTPAADVPAARDAEPLPRWPPISTVPTTCPKNDVPIAFEPMFTAFDGAHVFQVPAIVVGLPPLSITWAASDPTLIAMQVDFETGGVLITAFKPGVVDIVATAGALCGSAHLTIDATSPAVWGLGETLFDNGLPAGPGAAADGGTTGSIGCTSCHGRSASAGPFKTEMPTPEQTGGFSRAQLAGIMNGVWPDASGIPFDATIVSRRQWELFHRWSLSDTQAAPLVVYLRT
jgi:hypothetical protein